MDARFARVFMSDLKVRPPKKLRDKRIAEKIPQQPVFQRGSAGDLQFERKTALSHWRGSQFRRMATRAGRGGR